MTFRPLPLDPDSFAAQTLMHGMVMSPVWFAVWEVERADNLPYSIPEHIKEFCVNAPPFEQTERARQAEGSR